MSELISKPMQHYVLGFAYSYDYSKVLMIRKNRPKWQAGKFNGIGGHIESKDDGAKQAMYREFLEETGIIVPARNWCYRGELTGDGFLVYVFSAVLGQTAFNAACSQTDEQVFVLPVKELLQAREDVISNIPALIAVTCPAITPESANWVFTFADLPF